MPSSSGTMAKKHNINYESKSDKTNTPKRNTVSVRSTPSPSPSSNRKSRSAENIQQLKKLARMSSATMNSSQPKFPNSKSRSIRSQVKPLNLIGSTNSNSIKAQTPSDSAIKKTGRTNGKKVTKKISSRPSRKNAAPSSPKSPSRMGSLIKTLSPNRKGQKSTKSQTPKKGKGKGNGKGKRKDNVNITKYRERGVLSDGNELDEIEVAMKPHGMLEVTLVSSPKEDDEKLMNDDNFDRALAPQILPASEGKTERFGHTTDVHFKRMSTQYHPLCGRKGLHRVPTSANQPMEEHFKNKLAILKSYVSTDEMETAGKELVNLWNEMKAIENDREIAKQKKIQNLPHTEDAKTQCALPVCNKSWDINSYLDVVRTGTGNQKASNHILGKDQRRRLQQSRGAFVHAGFRKKDDLKEFATKCGGNPNSCQPHKSLQNCKAALFGIELISSTANTVRHLGIVNGENGPSFFVSKDDGRFHCGVIDARLDERLKMIKSSSESSSFPQGAIRYLSCGPNKSYFAELVSGRTLWSIGYHDDKFKTIVDECNVHRVAFGSSEHDSSWIVITKDGRVAWRNIPCRLHQLLQRRSTNQVSFRNILFPFTNGIDLPLIP